MVELNVRANQGITQAIATKLNLTSTDLKKLDASIWSGVMKDVQSSKSTNFTSKTNDVNSINDKNKNHSNFVIDKGAVKIDDGVWSKITTMIKNALNKSKPAATTAATTATTAATSTDSKSLSNPKSNAKVASNFDYQMQHRGSFDISNPDKAAKSIINGMNIDGKDGLTADEYAKYEKKTDTDGADYTEIYKSMQKGMDLDGDGILTAKEYSVILKNADQNNDRKVTAEEYQNLLPALSTMKIGESKPVFDDKQMPLVKKLLSEGYKLNTEDATFSKDGKSYTINEENKLEELN